MGNDSFWVEHTAKRCDGQGLENAPERRGNCRFGKRCEIRCRKNLIEEIKLSLSEKAYCEKFNPIDIIA